jgi:hypothetical protein
MFILSNNNSKTSLLVFDFENVRTASLLWLPQWDRTPDPWHRRGAGRAQRGRRGRRGGESVYITVNSSRQNALQLILKNLKKFY